MADVNRKFSRAKSETDQMEDLAMLQAKMVFGQPTPRAIRDDDRDSGALGRAQCGDQTAFAELVSEHQAMVFSLARYSLRNREVAEELAQDVFLSLYKNIQSIESGAHLKFWLRRVTSHRCIDYIRRNKVQPISVDDAPEPIAPAALDEFQDSMMRTTLRRMVATLPEKQRLVVTLRYQEDLDPTEIAEILGMPVNTVKSHLRRSLAMLKEKATRYFGKNGI